MINKISLKQVGIIMISMKFILLLYIFYLIFGSGKNINFTFDSSFYWFILAGFFAQLIDGTLGMAYGVSCNTILLNLGLPPAISSASVHTAEVFTTGVSGLSHIYIGNVDKSLFLKLVIPGVLGSVTGAFIISKVFDGAFIKPFIAFYLLIIGINILLKGLNNNLQKQKPEKVSLLGLTGGFFDSIGGGGWGPIVTSNLINKGNSARETIGTVNTAEFFVTFFSTGVFIFFLGIEYWKEISGLILGGIISAPIGALLVKRVNSRLLMIIVGIALAVTSCVTIYKAIS